MLRGGTPNAIWTLYGARSTLGAQQPIARCGPLGCTLELPTGPYDLWVDGPPGSDIEDGFRTIYVQSDADLVIRAPRRSAKIGGLLLAVAGKVALVTGAYVYLSGTDQETQACTFSASGSPACWTVDDGEDERVAGTALMLSGAVTIPLGWALFVGNRRPHVRARGSISSGPRWRPTPPDPPPTPPPTPYD